MKINLKKKNDIQFKHKYALYQGLKLIDYILLIRKFIQIYNLMFFFIDKNVYKYDTWIDLLTTYFKFESKTNKSTKMMEIMVIWLK